MTLPNEHPLQRLQFHVSMPYPCGYLKGRLARSLLASPHPHVNTAVYSELVRLGFRRSGKFAYRPYCEHCQACVPVRLPVAQFQPGRSQRRAWRKHANLQVAMVALQFQPEHFALYQAYQQARHPGAGMDDDGAEQYRHFLTESHVDTVLVEFREAGQLRMVSVVDQLQDGLSAVYTFYDCATSAASYGTYAILWLAEWCKALQLPYLYLGYWIAQSAKMAYKMAFKPLEALQQGAWQVLPQAEPAEHPARSGGAD